MVLKAGQQLLKILVCDDDPADRKLVQVYLRRVTGREIVVLEAGERAEIQKALDRGRIDLVLMDVQMPEKSGMEWLAEIVERQLAPVVILTGSGSEEVAVQALQEGAVGYLPKTNMSEQKLEATIDAALERWRQMQHSKANLEQLERLANYDSLTGLYNRGAILRKLEEQINHARRYKEEFSLSLMDIDHFKKVNDRYGHLIGDEVLEKVAELVREDVRIADSVGRYGGEEFIVVLPKTDLPSAVIVAERIREIIEATEMTASEGKVLSVTVSQGLCGYREGDDKGSLISRADEALYRAKETGRNRVETLA